MCMRKPESLEYLEDIYFDVSILEPIIPNFILATKTWHEQKINKNYQWPSLTV